MEQLVTVGLGLAASALLGLVKRVTGIADGKLGPIIKPVQPLVVAALAAGVPLIANQLGVSFGIDDAQAVANAPAAALVGILGRELALRIKGKPAL